LEYVRRWDKGKSDDRLPRMTIKQLWVSARDSPREVLKPRPQYDPEMDTVVGNLTAGPGGEVESGLLKGPYTPEQISQVVGKH
jgi:hypothetical protein